MLCRCCHFRRLGGRRCFVFVILFFMVLAWCILCSLIVKDLKSVETAPENMHNNSVRHYRYSLNDSIYEASIIKDNAMIVPGLGEDGVASMLNDQDAALAKEVMKKEAFNLVLSNKISLTRRLPDPRNILCRNVKYDSDLPTASIIVIFTNEAWSSLLRTVHSVLNRSPINLLKEIILVDDFSDKEHLKGKLDYYIKTRLPNKVHLLRLPERSGLIRARLAGAKIASAEVLVFLDSHCEVTEFWLEPLLQRIKESRTSVLMPIIDVISDDTMEYMYSKGAKDFFQIGGFTWSGHFTWINIPPEEEARRKSSIAPTRSPTMAGGLFAIERSFFWEIGSYDKDMDVWGGENLEMSFRVWMCGGSLEIVPCSRVGHIFRSFHPYTFPGGKDTHGINTVRLVEVWLDEYKRLFYLHRPDLMTVDFGNVTKRLEFRKKKKCKNFKWYLQNVYPQLFIPDENVQAYGRVQNSHMCLDTLQRHGKDTQYNLGIFSCNEQAVTTQFFSLTAMGELRHEDMCAEILNYGVDKAPFHVVMYRCHGKKGNQMWEILKSGEIVAKYSGLCLDSSTLQPGDDISASTCSGSSSQVWVWDNYIK